MEATDNVLIVEDDDEWCAIYERAARRQGVRTVRVAKSLAQARPLLDAMTFAVAFVDIGLDVDDDRNIDGLRVMDRIRALGDRTSVIVITGRSGRDVLQITRDAIKRYDAFDTVGKVPIEPAEIADLLARGLATYQQTVTAERPDTHHVLRGELSGWDWDARVLDAIRIRGGVQTLYTFIDKLFTRFLPVVPRPDANHVIVDQATHIACGDYWSRAIGCAVAICFGDAGQMELALAEAQAERTLLARYEVGELLHQTSSAALRGAVFALPNEPRGKYRAIG